MSFAEILLGRVHRQEGLQFFLFVFYFLFFYFYFCFLRFFFNFAMGECFLNFAGDESCRGRMSYNEEAVRKTSDL